MRLLLYCLALLFSTSIPSAGQCDSVAMGRNVNEIEDLIWSDYPRAIALAREMVAKSSASMWCEGRAYYSLGKVQWVNGDYKDAIASLGVGVRMSTRAHDPEITARSFLTIGNAFYFQGYYDSAEYYFNTALSGFQDIGHRTGQIEVLHDLTLMYNRKGDFAKSLKCMLEGEKLKDEEPDFVHYVGNFNGPNNYFIDTLYYNEEIRDELNSMEAFGKSGNQVGVYQSMINMAVAYDGLGNHLKAARYYVKGSAMMEKLGFYPFWYMAGGEFQKVGMKDSAMFYLYKSKADLPRATKIKVEHVHQLFADTHFKFGDYDSAEWHYRKSLRLNTEMNNRITMAGIDASLAGVLVKEKKFREAEVLIAEGIPLAREVSVIHLSRLYLVARDLSEAQGDLRKALHYATLYHNLTDSINSREDAVTMIRFQAQFETAKRERELGAARLQLNTRNLTLLSLAGLTLLSFASIATLYVQRRKIKAQNDKLRIAYHEQKALMQEAHHRVKNNLQYIVSLMSLQAQHIQREDFSSQMEEIKSRVMTIGTIHERLYQSQELQFIELQSFIGELIQNIFHALPSKVEVKRTLNVEHIRIDVESAISVGLIINELVTNSIKHAFVNNNNPEFVLVLEYQSNQIILDVGDNGPGFNLAAQSEGFGLKLIGLLLKKVNGTLEQLNPRRVRVVVRTFRIKR